MEHPESVSDVSLPDVIRQIANEAWNGGEPASFLQRARVSLRSRSPEMKHALRHTSADIVEWMHRGGPWRAFLVTVVGLVLVLGLAGFGVFMLFFLTATVNAVLIGLLASIASVGAFTALFFASLTAIYIGALTGAAIAISTITFLCICAALTAAGWVVFLWVVWQGVKKALDIFKGSILAPAAVFSTITTRDMNSYEKIHY